LKDKQFTQLYLALVTTVARLFVSIVRSAQEAQLIGKEKYGMKKTLLLSFVVLGATAFASSNSFKMNLAQDSVVEGKTLKAGDYKVSVENGNAVIKHGKDTIEVPAREATETDKFPTTSLIYKDTDKLSEVRFGGTHTKIVFEGAATMNTGQ
jgi:hypothetical protein